MANPSSVLVFSCSHRPQIICDFCCAESMSTAGVNPARLRKTAAATGHVAALSTPSATELPKGRRHREKVVAEARDKNARLMQETGIDLGSFLLYLVLSLFFYGAVIGWFFNINVFQRFVVTPFSYAGHLITLPFRLGFNFVHEFMGYFLQLIGIITSNRNMEVPKTFDPAAMQDILKAAAAATGAAGEDDF
ncbi:hypothetical protein DFJ73DRAFT_849180, partial [Zopfochytrium polystomum]